MRGIASLPFCAVATPLDERAYQRNHHHVVNPKMDINHRGLSPRRPRIELNSGFLCLRSHSGILRRGNDIQVDLSEGP
jgi:hypothetical protein